MGRGWDTLWTSHAAKQMRDGSHSRDGRHSYDGKGIRLTGRGRVGDRNKMIPTILVWARGKVIRDQFPGSYLVELLIILVN